MINTLVWVKPIRNLIEAMDLTSKKNPTHTQLQIQSWNPCALATKKQASTLCCNLVRMSSPPKMSVTMSWFTEEKTGWKWLRSLLVSCGVRFEHKSLSFLVYHVLWLQRRSPLSTPSKDICWIWYFFPYAFSSFPVVKSTQQGPFSREKMKGLTPIL